MKRATWEPPGDGLGSRPRPRRHEHALPAAAGQRSAVGGRRPDHLCLDAVLVFGRCKVRVTMRIRLWLPLLAGWALVPTLPGRGCER